MRYALRFWRDLRSFRAGTRQLSRTFSKWTTAFPLTCTALYPLPFPPVILSTFGLATLAALAASFWSVARSVVSESDTTPTSPMPDRGTPHQRHRQNARRTSRCSRRLCAGRGISRYIDALLRRHLRPHGLEGVRAAVRAWCGRAKLPCVGVVVLVWMWLGVGDRVVSRGSTSGKNGRMPVSLFCKYTGK